MDNISQLKTSLLIKSTVVAFVAMYLWSLVFLLLNGIHDQGIFVEPWYVLYFLNDGEFRKTAIIAGAIVGASLLVMLSNRFYHRYMQRLHGNAHWATEAEIRAVGLRDTTGVLLGKKRWKYLCTNSDEPILIYAPTGEGKDVGVAIPTLLNYSDSAVALDIKLELFNKTSGFRARHGHSIYLLDFGAQDGSTHRFNPLSRVPFDNKILRFDEIDRVANIFWSPTKDNGNIWQPGARDIFVAVGLYLYDTSSPTTIGGILRFVTSHSDFAAVAKSIANLDETDPTIRRIFTGFIQQAPKEQSGVISQLKSGLRLWNNTVVDAATSASDFDLNDLRRRRMTIYLSITADNLERMEPLLSLFFNQVFDTLVRKEPGPDEPYQVLGLLNEFTAMGKIHVLEKGLGFLRSYRFRLLIIVQGLSQIIDTYSQHTAETIQQNCKFKYILTPSDEKLAEKISKMLGTYGKKSFTSSSQGNMTSSSSMSYIRRELMSPTEILRMSRKKAIVLAPGGLSIKARKIQSYSDRKLKKRVLPPITIRPLDLENHYRLINSDLAPTIMNIIGIDNDELGNLIQEVFDE